MRLYLYIDKELIKKLAAKIPNIHFDIDFFEYSEKRGYTVRNDSSVRPDLERKAEEKDKCRLRVGVAQEQGYLSSLEVYRRYINIEDVSSIKNNSFYYSVIETLKEDNRIKKINGKIVDINEKCFCVGEDKFILDLNNQNELNMLLEYNCDLTFLGYKINSLKAKYDVLKTIAIYID